MARGEEYNNQEGVFIGQNKGNVHLDELYQDQYVNMEAEESPFDIEYEIKFIQKVDLDQEMHDTSDITLIGSSRVDQEMEEADSDLESMHDDKIISVLGNDDDDDDFEELSKADEISANNVIAKLISIANTGDADINVSAANAHESDPFGHLKKGIDFLATQVNNLELSLSQKVTDKIDSSVPKMVVDAIEEWMPDLLSDALKNILLQLLNDAVMRLSLDFNKKF
ncbi:hypothetical protein Tco_0287369 [Tanacetum coccineum]